MIREVNIEINSNNLLHLSLIGANAIRNESYFSVLVGSNGTNKSRILSSIGYYARDNISKRIGVKETKTNGKVLICSFGFSTFQNCDRLIAVSSSPFDKFPNGSLNIDDYSGIEPATGTYYYLGLKSKNGKGLRKNRERIFDILVSACRRDYIDSAVDSMLDCFSMLKFSTSLTVEWEGGDGRDFFQKRKVPKNYGNINNRDINSLLKISRPLKNKIFSVDVDVESPHGRSTIVDIINMERGGTLKIKSIGISKLGNNIKYDILNSSSGELFMLTHGLGIASCIRDYSIVLIDEPENSLHPNWQIEYIDFLKRISSNCINCHFIIATHSPHIVSGLPYRSSKVIGLTNGKNGDVKINDIDGSPSGWSVERILLEVFGIQTVRNTYFEKKVSEILRFLSNSGDSRGSVQRIDRIINEIEPFVVDGGDPLADLISDVKKVLRK